MAGLNIKTVNNLLLGLTIFLYVISLCGVQSYDTNSIKRHVAARINLNELIEKTDDPKKPLFLTPLIKANRIEEAQNLSRVPSFVGNVKSHAGYLTVNEHYGSNLFFWFFPASDVDWVKAPVTIWLQGGPGYSGFFALFNENGPYEINEDELKLRKYTWSSKSNLIFIDSPVGTGYSFTKSMKGFTRNQADVGTDLYRAMIQFFKMFPQLQNNPFYITGESYAGKYIPALGYAIHVNNPKSELKINLQGLFIGNGLTDPVNMIPKYADQLYALGFLDYNQKIEFDRYQNKVIRAIEKEDWLTATMLYTQLIIGYSFSPYPTLFYNLTGVNGYYNYVDADSAKWYNYETDFVTSNYFRKSVHVGNMTRNSGQMTENLLKLDIAKSVVHLVEELVENYRVTFYNGQLDIICAYPLTENFLRKMKWSGAEEYQTAKRNIWRVGKQVAGYVKTTKKLSDVLVRNSGHMVPTDQPKWAFELFNKFIYNIPLV